MKLLSIPKFNTKVKRSALAWNPIHPHRDWMRILGAFFILALLVVVWSAYLYYSYQKDATGMIVPEVADNSTTKDVEAITSFYEARKAMATSTDQPVFVDPSI